MQSFVPASHHCSDAKILLMLCATLAAARTYRDAGEQENEALRIACAEQMQWRARYTSALIERHWKAERGTEDGIPLDFRDLAYLPRPLLQRLAADVLELVREPGVS